MTEDPLRLASRKVRMNAFQERCSAAIGRTLSGLGLAAEFVDHPAAHPPEDGAAMFLRADLVHGGRHYKLYVYPDGAGAGVASNWFVLESQNYATPEALIQAFCDFLRGCLEGLDPVTALARTRR